MVGLLSQTAKLSWEDMLYLRFMLTLLTNAFRIGGTVVVGIAVMDSSPKCHALLLVGVSLKLNVEQRTVLTRLAPKD